jgi:2-iminobutanoate/2-iminopropanoate deaminase
MRSIRSNPSSVAPPGGPKYHPAVIEAGAVRGLLVYGPRALDADGVLVGAGDMAAQTEQVFENLVHILEAHGATFEDVVKIQTFVTTLEGFPEVREVRARYLPEEPPASTAVQVVALVMPEAMIEVDAVAVLPVAT